MKKIFDCHIHCSEHPDDLLLSYARANGLKYNFAELLAMMDENDVYAGLLLSPPLKGDKPLPNEAIISLCRKSKEKLFPVLSLEPSKRFVEATIKLAKQNREQVKAFKILLGYYQVYPDDEVFSKLYEFAEENKLPIMFHTGDTANESGSLKHSHPLNLDVLANSRPDLKIVTCHFGNPWLRDTAELLYKHRNVYADISGLFSGDTKYSEKYLRSLSKEVSEAIYFIGNSDKVIFGTDYPVETYRDAIRFAKSLDLSAYEIDKILGGNAKNVFSL